jgi:TATA-binding protein-associated factor Taf7
MKSRKSSMNVLNDAEKTVTAVRRLQSQPRGVEVDAVDGKQLEDHEDQIGEEEPAVEGMGEPGDGVRRRGHRRRHGGAEQNARPKDTISAP